MLSREGTLLRETQTVHGPAAVAREGDSNGRAVQKGAGVTLQDVVETIVAQTQVAGRFRRHPPEPRGK